jgi:Uma2 family endonuclease
VATSLASPVMTPEQLAALPNDSDFELVDGQLVERKMGNKSNWIATQLARLLSNYVDETDLGWVFAFEAGYRLTPDRPNNVRKPDVSFVRLGRLPNEEPADSYDYLAPDLAAEVISPSDTFQELEEKVQEYLTAGVKLVWVISPVLQTVTAYRPNGSIVVVGRHEDLTAEDIVPGFRCQVADLFAMPTKRRRDK